MNKKIEDKELLKCIKAYPIIISFTKNPKTGDSYILFKSIQDGGNHRMSDTKQTKESADNALDMVASLDNLPEGFLDEFKKAYEKDTTPVVVEKEEPIDPSAKAEELVKSANVDPEIKELVKGLTGQVAELNEKYAQSEERNRKAEEEKVEADRQVLRKSCEDTAETLELLPIEKAELSDLLYGLKESDSEYAESIQDVLVKCHEVIKKGSVPTEEIGSGDAAEEGKSDLSDPVAFRERAIDLVKSNDSGVSQQKKIAEAIRELRKSDGSAYLSFNKAVAEGKIEPIK